MLRRLAPLLAALAIAGCGDEAPLPTGQLPAPTATPSRDADPRP